MRTTQQLFDLTGKTALVTGGSRGLGLQIAEALGEQGAKIVLSSRKQSDLDDAVAHLKQRGIDASAIAADLSQEDAVAPLVAETLKRLNHIDILINNAGATWGAPAEDHPVGVGQGDESEHPQYLPVVAGGRQAVDDSA
jgi:NAD(P)-dependent dehydrogenase (short-subunit alcohol dehydrogenase family)